MNTCPSGVWHQPHTIKWWVKPLKKSKDTGRSHDLIVGWLKSLFYNKYPLSLSLSLPHTEGISTFSEAKLVTFCIVLASEPTEAKDRCIQSVRPCFILPDSVLWVIARVGGWVKSETWVDEGRMEEADMGWTSRMGRLATSISLHLFLHINTLSYCFSCLLLKTDKDLDKERNVQFLLLINRKLIWLFIPSVKNSALSFFFFFLTGGWMVIVSSSCALGIKGCHHARLEFVAITFILFPICLVSFNFTSFNYSIVLSDGIHSKHVAYMMSRMIVLDEQMNRNRCIIRYPYSLRQTDIHPYLSVIK